MKYAFILVTVILCGCDNNIYIPSCKFVNHEYPESLIAKGVSPQQCAKLQTAFAEIIKK